MGLQPPAGYDRQAAETGIFCSIKN